MQTIRTLVRAALLLLLLSAEGRADSAPTILYFKNGQGVVTRKGILGRVKGREQVQDHVAKVVIWKGSSRVTMFRVYVGKPGAKPGSFEYVLGKHLYEPQVETEDGSVRYKEKPIIEDKVAVLDGFTKAWKKMEPAGAVEVTRHYNGRMTLKTDRFRGKGDALELEFTPDPGDSRGLGKVLKELNGR